MLVDYFDVNWCEFWFYDGSYGVSSTLFVKFVKFWIDV